MKIILMGNPNVGKSTLFSRLTGVNVLISNFPGTTVEYRKGYMKQGKKFSEIMDVPGTYTLNPENKSEKVAVEMALKGGMILNIVDATNLERNLSLTLELLALGKPMLVALNFWDEARHTGIDIDIEGLSSELGVPVVPVTAVTGEGIRGLATTIRDAKIPNQKQLGEEARWAKIGRIIKKVQKTSHRDPTFLERLGDASIRPISGIPIAILILGFSFLIIRGIGEGLINYVLDPLFSLYQPIAESLSARLGEGVLNDLLIGTMVSGHIDFTQSLGMLTTGLYVPLAMVLPYVFAFYLVLGVLEDFGYLPRLAVLLDNIMHRIGLHGFAVIPMLLGLGCNVPGALAVRNMESKKERFIAATVMAISVPCMAQMAIIIGLIAPHGTWPLLVVFMTLGLVGIILSFIMNKLVKGKSPEMFMEISPYRIPYFRTLAKKLWMRMRSFFSEAIPYVMLGIFIVNILYFLGIMDFIARIAEPVISNVLGLPGDTAAALVIGFLRKDVAVGMLVPLGLTVKQLIIASVVLTMYFPCVATFTVLLRELGAKDLFKSALIMIGATLLTGGILNLVL